MPYIEQLLYGHNHLAETSGRQGLAHSAGMGADVAAEIGTVCDAWGQMPELGLRRRALLAYPLQSIMPSMRGRLHTIISVAPGSVPLFHAVVVTDAFYSGVGRNPYALAHLVEFCESWHGKAGMDRLEVDAEVPTELVSPPANPDDVGLVDEAVLQFILTGHLSLPLEQTVRDSDRAMALIIAGLPDKDRKKLKFASFTTNKVNVYDISCLATEGATFAGWQRLMMARIDTGVTDQQQEYKTLLAQYLARGDMAGIARLSSRHEFTDKTASRPLVATLQGETLSAPAAAPAPSPGATGPGRSAGFGPAATISPAGPGVVAGGHRGPGMRAAPLAGGTSIRRASLPDHGLDPTAGQVTAASRSSVVSRKRVRKVGSFGKGKRGAGGRFVRTVSVLLLLFCAGWVGTMWLEGRTLTESLEWAGLPGMDGGTEQVDHTGTLLEVVDVGRIYDRALRYTGNKGLGLNAAGDRGRDKALGRLQADATDPLLAQVALFVKLGAEGIQQSGRPDREVARLESLAEQGTVLEQEMNRLELAWYSLTTGVNWADLGRLSDKAVESRQDSLARVEKGALDDVQLGMGTKDLCRDLTRSRRQMDGMAAVVRLFQATHWSPSWEKKLAAAAENVSPTAGKTTRAYRNAAFALLRLKRAERQPGNRDLPFASEYAAAEWPSVQVKAVLPVLRKEAGRFSDQHAPALLGATLALYAALGSPDKAIDQILGSAKVWHVLQENAAVKFDPELYGAFLGRLRYEAAGKCLAQRIDPAEIPAYLYQGDARHAVAAFGDSLTTLTQSAQWLTMASSENDPFLADWARYLAGNLQARLARLRRDFEATWSDCRAQTVSLQAGVRSGTDWSDTWREVYGMATAARNDYAVTLSSDPTQSARFVYLDSLIVALTDSRPLRLARVTVRLDQGQLNEPGEIQLELRTPERGGVWTSEPFVMGPAAPAGTGWVGTAFLDWTVGLSPLHHLAVRVVTTGNQSELLQVDYPSLSDGVGPAALARPRTSGPGSVAFKAGLDDYWHSLDLPEMGPVF